MTHRVKSPWKSVLERCPEIRQREEKGGMREGCPDVFLAIMWSICLRVSTRMSSHPSIGLNASKNPFASSGSCVDSIVIAFFRFLFFFFFFGDRKQKLQKHELLEFFNIVKF